MFSLSFTTPSHRARRGAQPAAHAPPPPAQRAVTWGLVLIWLLLMAFGVICYVNPPWLQAWSQPGRHVEARDYKDYGDDLLRQGKYPLAITQYQHALKINPDQAGALVNLAIAYINIGQPTVGAQLLEDALPRVTLRKGVVYYNLGEILEQQGRPDEAIHYYRQAIGLDVQQDLVYRKLGALYLAAGRLEEAHAAFEQTLASQLDVTLPYKYMLQRSVDMYQEDDTHLPIIEEELARDTRPEDLARYDLQTVRRLHQRDPEIAKTHNHLGFICVRLGDIDQAIRHFEKSLDIWPNNIDGARNLQLLRQQRPNPP
jgi:tetratricopeptide (TPR) repeat protein